MSKPSHGTKAETDSSDTKHLPWIDGWELVEDYVADDVADPDEDPDDYYVTSRKRETTPLASPDDEVGASLFERRYVEWSGLDVSQHMADNAVRDLTIADAREEQKRVIRHEVNEGGDGGLGRTNYQYARIIRGDVFLREQQESTTTMMITLRQSPLDSNDKPIPPVTLRDRLSVSWQQVRGSVRSKLNYRNLPYEYILVASGTKQWATPHLHIYYYIDDPDEVVTRRLFEESVAKHINEHSNVTRSMHKLRADNEGAITLHDEPDEATASSKWDEELGRYITPTKGAVYLASQLPRMLTADEIKGKGPVRDTAWDTLAWSRASTKDSFSTSNGFPSLD